MRDIDTINPDTDLSSAHKLTMEVLAKNMSDYAAVVYGDDLPDVLGLSVFDAADAIGFPMLGIGVGGPHIYGGKALGMLLAGDGRYDLTTDSDSDVNNMHIEVSVTGETHSIFNGVTITSPLYLEDSSGWGDERSYNVHGGVDMPADWTVLATLGAGMSLSGQPTIVEFTTPAGTTVMLDGSAGTDDGYVFWLQDRWDILSNQVAYLLTL
ncbi:MAG: hypothetical protein KZQ93_05465 [Candidatus Thiodiazotropha sp. (ex Monitilora ramsayi)]|nr:hypothetical protein [Candidatus Thiodiazotropha sp. (ex Monitilora ramsayi)]